MTETPNEFKSKKILVTGAAGLIGYNFIKHILGRNKLMSNSSLCSYVVGIDALEAWGNDNMIENDPYYTFYNINCTDDKLDDIFKKHNFDYVYHFAAYAAEGLSPFIRKFNYENNVLSTVSIVNMCIKYGVKRLVYTSSMSVYGNGVKPGEKFDETDTLSPIDPYAVSKYACEMDIKIAGEQHGLDWCIIRPHNVFGVGQNVNDRYRNVIGIWMHQLVKDEPISIYGDGNQTRAFTVVDNILNSLYIASEDPRCSKQIINLGGERPFTLNEAADVFAKVIGIDRNKFKYFEERHEVKHAVPTNDKARDLLRYNEIYTFEEGLMKMWDWVLSEQKVHDWYKWGKFEIDNKIYSYWKI